MGKSMKCIQRKKGLFGAYYTTMEYKLVFKRIVEQKINSEV